MAKGVSSLIGEEVVVVMAEPSTHQVKTVGVLRETDDMGILLSAEDPTDGPIRVFVPWAAIAWIRAKGEYKPRKGLRVTDKPKGF